MTRFLDATDRLDSTRAASPSLLPGWTVGHVLTHVARNAAKATCGVRKPPSGGGWIEPVRRCGYTGTPPRSKLAVSRSAIDLADEVERPSSVLDECWRPCPTEHMERPAHDANGLERPASRTAVCRRWQEVEVPAWSTLDIGVMHRMAGTSFILECAAADPRAHVGAAAKGRHRALHFDDPTDELAWLYGRLRRDDLAGAPALGLTDRPRSNSGILRACPRSAGRGAPEAPGRGDRAPRPARWPEHTSTLVSVPNSDRDSSRRYRDAGSSAPGRPAPQRRSGEPGGGGGSRRRSRTHTAENASVERLCWYIAADGSAMSPWTR